jgi:transcriptional regulator with XRE-family HTH domain
MRMYANILSTVLHLCADWIDYAGVQMEWPDMDWPAIRREISKVRKERKVTLKSLKKSTGISPSTVNRIERVEKYPAHKPDLDTIYALVRAMGLTLSDFFAPIEVLKSQPQAGENLFPATARPISSAAEVHAHGSAPVSGGGPPNPFVSEVIIIDAVNKFVAAVDRLIADRLIAARVEEPRRQDAGTRPHQPVRHGHGRVSR